MKKIVILIAAASMMLVGCAKVQKTTTLIGTFQNKVPDEVKIQIPDENIDTVVKVADKTFKIEVPTSLIAKGSIDYEDGHAEFIPDGTKLTFAFSDESECTITSNQPKISVQTRFQDYQAWNQNFMKGYNTYMDSLFKNPALTDSLKNVKADAYYDSVKVLFNDYNMKALAANKNNLIAIEVLNNIHYDLKDAQVDSIINTLDSSVVKTGSISTIKKGIDSRKATAEGMAFSDFTVLQNPADTATEVKLSDYVGKGKYMLVDFWASWCGPCKREIPNVKNVYKKYHGDNFDVLSVAVWDQPEASKDTASVYGIEWNQIVNAQKIPTDMYGIEGIPHIILFGPDGKILKRDLRGDDIDTEVGKYVQPVIVESKKK